MTHTPEEIEDRLWGEIDRARFGMLGLAGSHRHFQPMTAFTEKPAGLIWFFASRDSELARVLADDGADAMFVVQSRDQGLQACVGGRLTLSHDRDRIERFWGPTVEAWHPQGRDDPNLTLMRLDCDDAEVWLTEAGPMKYAWEVARSNMRGERPDLAERAHLKTPLGMQAKLKPIGQQVIVITGATSGIGLSTARAAAVRGASLVLAARNEAALKTVAHDLASKGAKVELVVADVGKAEDVARIAKAAIARFGGFDTWVNNAGVGLFGELTAVSLEDQKKLFDTDYWGVVHGSLAAVEHLRQRPNGGALINVGSVLGDVAAPLQGAVSAAKHAVHAFTASLRMELAAEKTPVSVTLIRPGAVDTPYADNARSYLQRPWRNAPPIYAAPLVAQAILHAAEHRTRQLTIGGLAGGMAFFGSLAPPIAEPLIGWLLPKVSQDIGEEPVPRRVSNLHKPGPDLRERTWRPHVREQSIAVAAQMRPAATAGLVAFAAALATACFIVGRRMRGRALQPTA